MPHIHTQPGQHDTTASGFIIRIDGDEPRLLLHKHKLLGSYMQFGGHVELDETPWQAVQHEIREESGYDLDQLQLLQPKNRLKHLSAADLHPTAVCQNTHKVSDMHFHTDTVYAFVTVQEPRHKQDEGESAEIGLYSRAELENLNMVPAIREIALYVFDTCLKDWEAVTPAA